MSQSDKAHYYRLLKDAGLPFTKHYRDYSTDELKEAVDKLVEGELISPEAAVLPSERPAPEPIPQPQAAPAPPPEPQFDPAATAAAFAALAEEPQPEPVPQQAAIPQRPQPRRGAADPDELPGVRQNSQAADEPIRVDENGLIWYQEEVRKPAYPRPRGRRVLTYMDTGTKVQTAKNGEYVESFEVAGDEQARPAEVKITLPSYQVGIYKDPRFPFKIHVYNESRGFDFQEVQRFYGGSELVPVDIKRVYVENVLCYDIRTTIRAIQTEYRQQQLVGGARA